MTTPTDTTILPHSADAELGLLCSLFLCPGDIFNTEEMARLQKEHFHIPAHALVFAAMQDLFAEKRNIDRITVTQLLRDRKQIDQIGGAQFLAELFDFVPTAANWRLYLATVQEKRMRREFLQMARNASADGFNEVRDVTAMVADYAQRLASLVTVGKEKPKRSFRDAIMDKLERMESDRENEDMIPTGLELLDKESPLRKGDMPLIAGERKAGKSIVAITLAVNIAQRGKRVLYFSLEDRESKVVDRIVAGISRIPIIRHSAKLMTLGELSSMQRTVAELANLPIMLRDDLFDLVTIAAVIRQEQTQNPDLGVVVIDYAQLIQCDRKKTDNREQEVAMVSRTLRLLAMETGLAIILLSQLNEEGKSRESRALENDATAMWRIDHVYRGKKGQEEKLDNERMLVVPWQRNGGSNVAGKVTFLGHIARVENYAGEEE
ncbi:MAG TPA: replicative DNA helicase [Chthoniobacterales bacterium]